MSYCGSAVAKKEEMGFAGEDGTWSCIILVFNLDSDFTTVFSREVIRKVM